MGEPLYLLLGIHHHQPVGNFDGVFAEAFAKCYRPLLEALERHPRVRISLHHSGPLLDWAEAREPGYLDRVMALVARGQIEIMGGGYYEPILPIQKPRDALGQIEMMQRFWEARSSTRPAGMWLAERVWEPSIATLMADAGMAYTVLDDQHFRHAGITDETLFDYYRTERAGKAIAIFPTDKTLRYLIPFREAHEVIDHLLSLAKRFPGRAITYGDDGEKFGMWPGTYKWVIEEGWLERFFAGIEAHADRITPITFSECLTLRPPAGTIYLPTASYSEMLEWAMPAEAILRYESAKRAMERAGVWEQAAAFFRGGFWDNFLTKYPESNLQHKRSIAISDRIDAAEAAGHDLANARRALYRAQCNCAYWHGLFGGIYLNYLRHALYHHMIEAECAVDRALHGDAPFVSLTVSDIDVCGAPEAALATREVSCIVKPSAGGAIVALDFRPARFNLLNTFARRFEAYHRAPQGAAEGGGGGGVASIHDIGKDIGAFAKDLIYDRGPRYAFVDHAFFAEPEWARVADDPAGDVEGLRALRYAIGEEYRSATEVSVSLEGALPLSEGGALALTKSLCLGQSGALTVRYRIRKSGAGRVPLWFATEFNFTLLAGHDSERLYRWSAPKPTTALLDERATLEGIRELELLDRAFGFRARIAAGAERWVLAPVETVSQSEQGFDKLYQGSVVWMAWRPRWTAEGVAEFAVNVALEKLEGKAIEH
jgi:4-alpha-glucanotransferase